MNSKKKLFLKKENNNNNNIEKLNNNPMKKYFSSLILELKELENVFQKKCLDELKDKNEDELKIIIPEKKLEFENRVKLILDKAEKELNFNTEQYKNIQKKNSELKNNIKMMNLQKERLILDIKEAELSIEKINKKYEIFSKLRPYYESLAFEFNINDKNKNIKEDKQFDIKNNFEKRKNYVKELQNKIESKNDQIMKLKEEMKKEEIINENSNAKLFNYFIKLEQKDKEEEENYKEKISNIKQNIEYNQIIQKENHKILNDFISIYNLLYSKLNLQRDIIEKPKNIDLIINDYTPQTFLTDEIMNYIDLMLANSNEESCGILLREIASYAYMILREENPEFNTSKYDPVKIVQQIENYLKKIKEENKSLNDEIEKIKEENNLENKSIKKMNKQIKQINNMYEILNNTIKSIYSSDHYKKDKVLKKCLSDNNINLNKNENDKNNLNESTNSKRFIYLRKYLEEKKNKKIEFAGGADNFIRHINRLFFYKNMIDIKPKDIGIYVNAHKRMHNKFYKLKKLNERKEKFKTVETALI